MLAIPCPWCGTRPRLEFAYTGEADRSRPDGDDIEAWRRYLYFHPNSPGWIREHWLHFAGCGRLVVLDRHRSSNEIRPVAAAGGVE